MVRVCGAISVDFLGAVANCGKEVMNWQTGVAWYLLAGEVLYVFMRIFYRRRSTFMAFALTVLIGLPLLVMSTFVQMPKIIRLWRRYYH